MSSRNANKRRKVKGLSSKSSEDTVVDFELELENSEIMNKLVTEFAKVATTLEKMVKERQPFTSGLLGLLKSCITISRDCLQAM